MAAARCVGRLLELNSTQFLEYLASTVQTIRALLVEEDRTVHVEIISSVCLQPY